MRCLKCSNDVPADSQFCPHCGDQLASRPSTMKRCPFCAEEIQSAAITCKHCGRDLTGKSQKKETGKRSGRQLSLLGGLAMLIGLIGYAGSCSIGLTETLSFYMWLLLIGFVLWVIGRFRAV